MTTRWCITGRGPLRGRVRMPSDVHVGLDALLFAALSAGSSRVRGLSLGEDARTLLNALRTLGVAWVETADEVQIHGVGLSGLRMPQGVLDAGQSVSTLVLLAALLSGQHFGTRIEARGHARERSLRTLLEPLRARGAHIAGSAYQEADVRAPVAVAPLVPGEELLPVEIEIPLGDSTTKRALLISGLFSSGVTAINEGLLSRDHTERALLALGLPIETMGPFTLLDSVLGPRSLPSFTWDLPGDFGLASFVVAAALAIPGSHVVIEHVGVNRTRTAFFDALRHAGARIVVLPTGDVAGNEPVADVHVQSSTLRSVRAAGELAYRLSDDLAAFAALVASVKGRVALRDAGALRARPGNPLKETAHLLRSFGAECTDYEDGFDAEQVAALSGCEVPAAALPESKLLAVTLGLCSDGQTCIDAGDQLDALYPGWRQALVVLGADIRLG